MSSGGITSKTVVPAYLTWTDDAGVPHQMHFDLVKEESYEGGADVTEHPVETGANITDNVRNRLDKYTLELFLTNEPIDSNDFADLVLGPQALTYQTWKDMLTERALLTFGAGTAGGIIGGAAGGAGGGGVGSAVGAVGGGVLGSLLLQGHATTELVNAQLFQFPGGDEDFVAETISKLKTLKEQAQLFDLVAPKLLLSNLVIESLGYHRSHDTGTGAEVQIGLKEIRFVTTTNVPAPAPTVARAIPPVKKGEQNLGEATDAQKESVLSMGADFVKGLL